MATFRCNKWFICSFIAAVLGFLKRILFGRFHRRNRSDTNLPTLASNISTPAAADNSLSERNEDIADWDDWDYAGAPTDIIIEPNNPSIGPTAAEGGALAPVGGGVSPHDDDIPEMDYFSDMAPTLKKTVLIRKKDRSRAGLPNSGVSNRLSMNVDITPVASSELSAWDDEMDGTWEDEASALDLSRDADRVIKEKKQAERDRRAAEQHRKKMEREAQRAFKKDGGKLAVKLK
ncbi:receptor-binding cancer antigen expressed on SiSo cells-like [Acanthaster planci]|uniref:Receptor-binding cancer antigen expressed on SiSo cells-like n=1 Tax=Acanthaster planci TaxID=133434 RepID=A0A8B7ZXS2_ACAPL|nr:receptor-binding cancer antigen expressed on SiSo cells-like [Acanthaster planci]XP_022109550.1 receptor-binding cancer antigen expressed on SiSo cells-like [Acanthaster planci]